MRHAWGHKLIQSIRLELPFYLFPTLWRIWGTHLCCFTFPLLRKFMSSSLVWRHNVWCNFFPPRYDVKTWMKKVVSHVMTSIVWHDDFTYAWLLANQKLWILLNVNNLLVNIIILLFVLYAEFLTWYSLFHNSFHFAVRVHVLHRHN